MFFTFLSTKSSINFQVFDIVVYLVESHLVVGEKFPRFSPGPLMTKDNY